MFAMNNRYGLGLTIFNGVLKFNHISQGLEKQVSAMKISIEAEENKSRPLRPPHPPNQQDQETQEQVNIFLYTRTAEPL